MRHPRWLACAIVALAFCSQACHMPNLADYQKSATPLKQTSFLYDDHGKLITELHASQDRVILPTKKIPQSIRDAAVAVEDKRFYQHHGVDARAILRAAYIDATQGRIVEGGSTITQQLVKNIYVGDEQTLNRKILEAELAWQVENTMTKDQILTKYLNTVYFGEGAYGVQAAAKAFFNKDAEDLTISQSALLAGLISSPNDFDPFRYPVKATKRRNEVLGDMLSQNMIGKQVYSHALDMPLNVHVGTSEHRYIAPFFVDYFKQWFLSNPAFGDTYNQRYNMLFSGGLRITTTLDPRMQRYAEKAVQSVLPYSQSPYASVVSLDPRTGYVRAMVGGRNYWSDKEPYSRLNLATGGSSGRQTGSAFKPFALVTALENGFTPNSPLNGSFARVPLSNGTSWIPQNSEGTGAGTISLTTATVDSINIAYVNLEIELGNGNAYEGAKKIVATAKQMGIRCCPRTTQPGTPLEAVPAAVLGSNEMSPLEMASAYGTFATGGRHIQPTPVSSIRDAQGNIVWQPSTELKQVVDPSVIGVADHILQQVVQYGTGYRANIGRPQIGKTGTNQNFSDAWFIGSVPQLTTAVWVGFPRGQVPMRPPNTPIEVFGGTYPAMIWHNFMIKATSRMRVKQFPSPSVHYVSVAVDVTQSPYCLPNQYTLPQNIKTLQFIDGTQPTKTCRSPSSSQKITVPSVVGMTLSDAVSRLRGAGFYVSIKRESSTQPGGTVIAQSPSAGTSANQSSTVTITVSRNHG